MIEKPIVDTRLNEHLSSIAGDTIDLFLLNQGTIRLACIHGTTLVNHARANHELSARETVILGEALLVTGLVGTNLKEDERVSLLLESDGETGGFVTDVNNVGRIRGYLRNRVTADDDADDADGSVLDRIPALLGEGAFDVLRADTTHSEASRGHIQWKRGGISWNLERYYRISEQTPTCVRTDFHTDGDQRILGAAAVLIQQMPGGTREEFDAVGATVRDYDSLARRFAEGQTPPGAIREIFTRWRPELVATRNTEFYCPCSKERFARFLGALPSDEAKDILENGPIPLRTTCFNCSTEYEFDLQELKEILDVSGRTG